MNQHQPDTRTLSQYQPDYLAKLICKLRWIGMEREAEALQATLCHMRRSDSVLVAPVARRRDSDNQIRT